MFTDMVGYSALMGRDQTVALRLLEEHRALVRPLFAEFGGLEVKTIGDAFLVLFTDAAQSVRCALRMQALLSERNARVGDGERVRLRIGLHAGEFFVRHGDVYGD